MGVLRTSREDIQGNGGRLVSLVPLAPEGFADIQSRGGSSQTLFTRTLPERLIGCPRYRQSAKHL